MNKNISVLAVLLCSVVSWASIQIAETDVNSAHARNYSFGFIKGNLLPNFSFEDGFYGWYGTRMSRHDLELKEDKVVPITGSYVGLLDMRNPLSSDLVPVQSDEPYTLSLYEINYNKIDYSPKVCFYASRNALLNCAELPPYAKSRSWSYYKSSFTTPSTARFAEVVLGKEPKGYFYFDDVVLEKGAKASDRGGIGVGITYLDALGRGYAAHQLVRKESLNELLPGACVNNQVVYGASLVEIGARSSVLGGNVGSGANVTIDNDVSLKDETLSDLTVSAAGRVRLGDRVSVHGKLVYGDELQLGNQDYVQSRENVRNVESCEISVPKFEAGSADVYVDNDTERSLVPGTYKDAMVRARSVLHLAPGEYYFDKFTLEPTAKLDFDLSQGNVVIHVKSSLWINDNSEFVYDAESKNFIAWYLSQESGLRLGTITNLAGVFVAPKARVELGHQGTLNGMIYAKEVFLMQDSKIAAPAFLFGESKNIYAVSERRYDDYGRVYQQDKSYIVELSSEGYVQKSRKNANEYYSENGEGPDAGGFAYSETEFSKKDGHVIRQSITGADWSLSGSHTGKSEQFFVSTLNIPSSVENIVRDNEDRQYLLFYGENTEGAVALSWRNRLGQLVKTANVVEKNGSDMRKWRWAVKQYEYTREGLLSRTLTPLDNKNGGSKFAIVSKYDKLGRMVSRESPDIGLESFHYDMLGNVIFSVSAEQRARNAFTYKKYDAQGRLVSVGESVVPQLSSSLLDDAAKSMNYIPGESVEYTGKGYDKLSKCLDAIGSDELRNSLSGVNLTNTRGRVVCGWSRNPKLHDVLSSDEALVADFFSYDDLGRVKAAYRYTGAERDVSRRLISKHPVYDDLSNLLRVDIRDASGELLSSRSFEYDAKGRAIGVSDEAGNTVARYSYDDFGQQSRVVLGDVVQMDYERHLHGQVSGIKATNLRTGAVVYEETLNYEKSEGFSVPRFDGRISQKKSSVKITDDLVENSDYYMYDLSGNMVTKLGTSGEAWYQYDENGRLLAQQQTMGSLSYNYADGSYKVTDVAGKSDLDPDRDASQKNNFVYDASGRVVSDASKQMSIEYDMGGSTVSFTVSKDEQTLKVVNVYDPQGWRVAVLSYVDGELQSLRTDIMVDGRKELERRTDVVHDEVKEFKTVYGAAGVLGRVLPDNSREWYVKDYQGSLVMTLVNDEIGNVITYEPYGTQKRLQVGGDVPSEQYSGKELDEVTNLYYYGMRFFDPTLAMWMMPDPARQYLNPYGFGGDPINAVDLYGLWKFGLGITIGWEKRGFTLGVGAALDVGTKEFGVSVDLGASHNFGDGSNTYSANVGASINIGIVGIGANLGYSYNTISGSTLSYGVRGSIYGAGIGVNGANYWDASGSYMGGTFGVETFYGAFGAEVYTGYEWGYSGMDGRGLYTGARAWGAHAEFTNIGTSKWGFNYGFTASLDVEYDFSHPSGISHDRLEKAYEMQQSDNMSEVFFSDVDEPQYMSKGDGGYEPNFSENAEIEGHTHRADHKSTPSNVDNDYAYDHADKRHLIINSNREVIEYKGVENPYRNEPMPVHTPPSPQIINTWSINARKGWGFSYRHGKWRGSTNRLTGKWY